MQIVLKPVLKNYAKITFSDAVAQLANLSLIRFR